MGDTLPKGIEPRNPKSEGGKPGGLPEEKLLRFGFDAVDQKPASMINGVGIFRFDFAI